MMVISFNIKLLLYKIENLYNALLLVIKLGFLEIKFFKDWCRFKFYFEKYLLVI